jgi:hypothetical protein
MRLIRRRVMIFNYESRKEIIKVPKGTGINVTGP